MISFAKHWRKHRWPALIGLLAGLVVLAILGRQGTPLAGSPRESVFDMLLRFLPGPPDPRIIVIDIDRDSLAAHGPWPWRRDVLARLLKPIVNAKPSVVGVDIVLAGTKNLHEDLALANALRGGHFVLAAALDPDGDSNVLPEFSIVTIGQAQPMLPAVQADALVRPPEALAGEATVGIVALPTDETGRVRTVPLLAEVGPTVLPAFALEIVRRAKTDATPQIVGAAQMLRVADVTVPLQTDALLRVRWTAQATHAARTVSAGAIMSGAFDAARLANAIVLVGSSAPEAGGLRPTVMDAFAPAIQIQADAVTQFLSGKSPQRPAIFMRIERALAAALIVAGIVAALVFAPVIGAMVMLAIAAVLFMAAIMLFRQSGLLFDALLPAATGAAAWQAAALAAFAITRRDRAAIERRFARHLAPAVVQKIIDNPDALKLKGEARPVTALFTDIEGFTALTDRVTPETLIAILDGYVTVTSAIVTKHGGMVDKIVGDAVHALFNAPIDLPDHVDRAIDCALELVAATEEFRHSALAAPHAVGRTRVGIETGTMVVGEIGGGDKLDYTAHGASINLAARLEQANKLFGSSILVGPQAVRASQRHRFAVRGTIKAHADAEPVEASEPASHMH
ncbi:MAG: CHASE2 domain-containing protein [Beijerinckiaceae bacterium]